jgi:hypothetical protein
MPRGTVLVTCFRPWSQSLEFSGRGAVMSATREDVTRKKPEPTAEELAAEEIVRQHVGLPEPSARVHKRKQFGRLPLFEMRIKRSSGRNRPMHHAATRPGHAHRPHGKELNVDAALLASSKFCLTLINLIRPRQSFIISMTLGLPMHRYCRSCAEDSVSGSANILATKCVDLTTGPQPNRGRTAASRSLLPFCS